MKILVATFSYPPNLDGISMASFFLAKTLSNAGHSVRVATNGHHDSRPTVDLETGVSTFPFGFEGSAMPECDYTGEINRYLDFLKDYSPDVVFLQCWHTWYADLTIPLKKELGFRCVMISHGYVHHMIERPWSPPWGIRRWWRRRTLVRTLPTQMRSLDHVVFLSEHPDFRRFFDLRLARKLNLPNVSIIPNSVSIDGKPNGSNFRSIYNIGYRLMFLFPANYCVRKNQKMALRCFMKAAIPNSVLIFAGSELGQYGSELKSIWEQHSKTDESVDVIFLENLSRESLLDAFDACDIVLLTAYAETQPIVILESMAFGKPFLCTNVGCVNDFSGGVVISSERQLTHAMSSLAINSNIRNELGNNGRKEYKERYSPPAVESMWLELLQQLVK